MVTTTIKRLWIPKRIDSKWHWLKMVRVEEEHKPIFIDGKHTTMVIRKYKLI